MMEQLGQLEIIEANLRDDVMTTQEEKKKILAKVKRIQNKTASVTTVIKGMKSDNKNIQKYNEILSEARNNKPKLMKFCAMIILKY